MIPKPGRHQSSVVRHQSSNQSNQHSIHVDHGFFDWGITTRIEHPKVCSQQQMVLEFTG